MDEENNLNNTIIQVEQKEKIKLTKNAKGYISGKLNNSL